jgi:hypothetical protein
LAETPGSCRGVADGGPMPAVDAGLGAQG